MATSLRSLSAGLRTGADIADQLAVTEPARTARVRAAADAIDRAADTLAGLRGRVDAMKSAKAVVLTRELVSIVREAAAASTRLADGLASARRETEELRERIDDLRRRIAFWAYLAATGNTLVWTWAGLGQLCLFSWGRRRVFPARPTTATTGAT